MTSRWCQIIMLCGLGMMASSCQDAGTLSPQQELDRGVELSLRYSFDKAREHFARARAAADTGSDLWLQATLGEAVAVHHEVPLSVERIEQIAVPLYEAVVAQGGHSLLAARAALHLGRFYEQRDVKLDTVQVEKASRWYRMVIDGWTAEEIAGEATLRLAVCSSQGLDPEHVRQGVDLAIARASSYPKQIWAASLWQFAGDLSWVVLHDREAAIRLLLKAEAAGLPDRSSAWVTAWRIAVLAEEAGQREVAIEHYRQIITEFSASGKAFEAQLRLRQLGVDPPALQAPLDLVAEGDVR
jgi:TPR repeat protein